jgi:hypothetical protein
MSVTAPPTGVRACGQQVSLEDHGDVVTARLCLTNERLDPRPAAHPTRGGDRGPAPFWVNLDASSSVVPDGVASWHWEFGDGISSVQGPTVSHRYDEPGTYPVTATPSASVASTRSAVAQRDHGTADRPGFVSPEPEPTVGRRRSVRRRSVGQRRRLSGTIRAYVWDFGDGARPQNLGSGGREPSLHRGRQVHRDALRPRRRPQRHGNHARRRPGGAAPRNPAELPARRRPMIGCTGGESWAGGRTTESLRPPGAGSGSGKSAGASWTRLIGTSGDLDRGCREISAVQSAQRRAVPGDAGRA